MGLSNSKIRQLKAELKQEFKQEFKEQFKEELLCELKLSIRSQLDENFKYYISTKLSNKIYSYLQKKYNPILCDDNLRDQLLNVFKNNCENGKIIKDVANDFIARFDNGSGLYYNLRERLIHVVVMDLKEWSEEYLNRKFNEKDKNIEEIRKKMLTDVIDFLKSFDEEFGTNKHENLVKKIKI